MPVLSISCSISFRACSIQISFFRFVSPNLHYRADVQVEQIREQEVPCAEGTGTQVQRLSVLREERL